MNIVQGKIIEKFVKEAVSKASILPNALCEALDVTVYGLDDAILEVIDDAAYIEPDDMTLTPDSVDDILNYAIQKRLDLNLGFSSVLESYVMSQITKILGIDLLELI